MDCEAIAFPTLVMQDSRGAGGLQPTSVHAFASLPNRTQQQMKQKERGRSAAYSKTLMQISRSSDICTAEVLQ